jgi:hypothetical protein
MAFSIRFETDGVRCAKCHKQSTEAQPLLDLWVTGRAWRDRNYIEIHEDCLLKSIARLKKKAAVEAAKDAEALL